MMGTNCAPDAESDRTSDDSAAATSNTAFFQLTEDAGTSTTDGGTGSDTGEHNGDPHGGSGGGGDPIGRTSTQHSVKLASLTF